MFPPGQPSLLSSQIPETALLLKSKHLNHDPMEHTSYEAVVELVRVEGGNIQRPGTLAACWGHVTSLIY